MVIRFLLLVFLLCSNLAIAVAQNEWSMMVTVSGGPIGNCLSIASDDIRATFNGVTYPNVLEQNHVRIFFVYSSTGNFSGNIVAQGSYICNCSPGPNCVNGSIGPQTLAVIFNPDEGDGRCVIGSQSFQSSNYRLTISYRIYRKMRSPSITFIPDGGCNASEVELTSASQAASATSYQWQVSDNGVSNWKTILNKNTRTISLTAAELNQGFTTSLRYVRVNDTGCTERGMGHASNSFQLFLPSPTSATVNWEKPKCFGRDDGTVTVSNIMGQASAYLVKLKYKEEGATSYSVVYQTQLSGSDTRTISKADINSQFPAAPGIKKGSWMISIENNMNTDVYGSCARDFPEEVGEPDELLVNATAIIPLENNGYAIRCKGQSGSINASASGGTPGYTYTWSTGATGASVSSLPEESYTVTVKDANGCEKLSLPVSLTAPNALTISIATQKALDCAESVDGELIANTSGGVQNTAPGEPLYSWLWSTAQTSVIADNLSEGNYKVDVTDKNGCTASSANYFFDAPEAMQAKARVDEQITCHGSSNGKASVFEVTNYNGLEQMLTYDWSTGDFGKNITQLTSGTYSVTVTDTKNCKANASVMLTDPIPWTATIEPVLAYHGKPISCNGESDGRVDVVVKNESGVTSIGEFYTWSTGESGNTKTFIDNLADGTYEVTVKYNGTCTVTSSYRLYDPEPVTVTIAPDVVYNGQLISCYNKTDASVRANVSGGTGVPSAFGYMWNTGVNQSLLSNVGSGTYSVTVTDVNGCTGSQSLIIDNPSPVKAEIISFSNYKGYGVSCFGASDGALTAGGTGGTGVFSYQWSDGKTTALNDQLATGAYKVIVVDNNGCKDSITHTINTPAALNLDIAAAKDVSCFGLHNGAIALSATGGVESYRFSNDGGITLQSAASFDQLSPRSYIFTVVDANSCSAIRGMVIHEPDPISISFTDIEPAFCADPRGKVTGEVSGGVGNYQYTWRRRNQMQVLGTAVTLSNIPAGIYELFVSDGNECPADNSVAITSTDGPKALFKADSTRCFDSADGRIIITAIDGDGDFTIEWSDGQQGLVAEQLRGGDYDALIADVHGCATAHTVNVPSPAPLQVNVLNEIMPTCDNFCDGSLTVQASGGKDQYSYAWNNKTEAEQHNLCAGTYPVVVQDINGCILNTAVELHQPAVLDLVVSRETLATCENGCDGALEVTATGGNGNYQYMWSAGGNATIKQNICPGIYQVSVTDRKGCLIERSVTLHNTLPVSIDLGGGITLCTGQTHVLDAGQWVSTIWKGSDGFSSTDRSITIKEPGSYFIEVLNNQGCVGRDTFLLETSTDLLKARFLLTSEAYAGDTVVMVNISYPVPENVTWHYPATMKNIFDSRDVIYGQFNDEGIYEIRLTAQLGECRDELIKTITILPPNTDIEGGRLGYEEFVRDFTLYTNPNNGSFNVRIILQEESPVLLSIWSTVTNRFIGRVTDKGKKSYLKFVDLRPLSSGNYILRLDHARGSEYIRFNVE
jgi:hypothetical protein